VDIAEEGHIDSSIRRLIAKGRPLHHVYRAASHSAARIFGLKDRGLVAPGWRADIVLPDDLGTCAVSDVIAAGRLIRPEIFAARYRLRQSALLDGATVKADDFVAPASPRKNITPVIGVRRTHHHLPRGAPPRSHDLRPSADLNADVIKVTVIERHGRTAISAWFCHGFWLEARHRLSVGRQPSP
jgi:adenine deaminase